MKDIGGYFEVEFSNIELGGLHTDAIKLNTGRNCFEYIINTEKYSKIYIPYYICDLIINLIVKCKIQFEFYSINSDFEIIDKPSLSATEALLYVNYFGLKNEYIKTISINNKNLIIDNSQALFNLPISGVPTFYSLRKFVGVPDGAFLYYKGIKQIDSISSDSSERVSHLYKRKNLTANDGYKDFQLYENAFGNMPITSMSKSTQQFIKSYDFNKNKVIRERNFLFIHNLLSKINLINSSLFNNLNGPLCYPLLIGNNNLRSELLKYNIYIPLYWPNLMNNVYEHTHESYIYKNLFPLPIDHRYSIKDMEEMSSIILDIINKQ